MADQKASKRPHPEIGDDEQSEDGEKPPKKNCPSGDDASPSQQSSAQVENEKPPEYGKKGSFPGHGNRFQSKLLMLFALRAINAGYQFYLGTELSVGDKFDDLIFHYKEGNDVKFRRQYLQAKHRENEQDLTKNITANDLLDMKNGDFSLLKYFQSYGKIISKGNDIEHCIICTNVDFDRIDIKNNRIKLKRVDEKNWPKLLNCKDIKNDQACYRIKDLGNLKNTLFVNLQNCVTNCTGGEMKSLFQNCTEVVKRKPFNEHTADEMKNFFIKSPKNQVIKNLIEIVFDDFLDKLIFAVKSPNEDELDSILSNEVGKHFNLSNAALQSAHFMNEMVNWFKLTDIKHLWLTAEEAKKILNEKNDAHIKIIELTSLSLDYQKQLKRIETSESYELEFEDTVINQLTSMLQLFWNSQEKIKHVSSKTPKLTAVKVFSAIKQLPKFPKKDDYLVISSHSLKEKEKKVVLKESLEANINNGHRLLVVVDEGSGNPIEDDFEKFITDKTKRKIIVISSQNFTQESYNEDTITYGQLNENTKKVLRERQVSFQGNDLTVNDLIDMKLADNVLDSQLIENLLQMAGDYKIVIPSFNNPSLENSLYIERKLKFLSKDQLLNKLANIEENSVKKVDEQMKSESNKINEEIEIDQNGKIKWKTEDEKRIKEIWEKITVLLKQINSSDISLLSTVSEIGLIDKTNKRIIITGVAGTGKSTILSNYYEEIKKAKSDYLVIKISLMNYSKALLNEKSINDFLINNVMGQNAFARQLLKHRLETGDQIILMLDGFDEIDSECQNKFIELVKTLNESIPLYITTRPHLMADKLQFELSQLPYSFDKFTEEDQIKYLTLIWTTFLTKENVGYKVKDKTVKKFATDLIEHVSEILNDKEKQYCGIPLHCRILAECFQSKIKKKLLNQNDDANYDLSHLLDEDQQFDLASLFKQRIKDMRLLFEPKIYVNYTGNHIVNLLLKKTIRRTEVHLLSLAIKTIVGEKNSFISISPSSSEFQSEFERENEEKSLNELGIRFGLLNRENMESEVQFLHRSYAEYLVTEFVFNGFLFDEEKHNSLLDNESARKWIIKEMLVEDNYEGLRVFFDSMLKEILNEDKNKMTTKIKWKNRIQNLNLPNCLQEFVCLLFEDNRWSLRNGFEERNYNIVLLIFCCLDAALHKPSTETTEKLKIFKMLGDKLCFPSVTAFCIESDELTQQLLKIATFIYSADSELTNFLKEALVEYLDRKDFIIRIENLLTILQEMGRINVAAEISLFLHTRESNKLQQNENTISRSSSEEMTLEGLHNTPIKDEDGHRICQMANKRPYLKIGGDLTEPSVDGTKPPKFNCPNENNSSPSQTPLAQVENEKPPYAGEKGNDAGHGNRFQSKLLMLYAVRAINFGYQFYLGTELSVGDKFDNLIFHYKEENDVTFRQQYLQAKHRLNENDLKKQITANHLLDVKKGDFSLLKYFQSYVKIRGKGNEIEHCIICTNVDFNYKDITNNGITLKRVDEKNWPNLLNCKDIKNKQACYKIKHLDNFKNTVLLGNILNCVTKCTGDEMKSLFQNCTEVVNGKQFNDHTADKMNNFFIHSTQNQNQLLQKLVEFVFDDYLDKLIFVVKTPNEDELDSVLTEEVGKYFKSKNREVGPAFVKRQLGYIRSEMENWFKRQDNIWLTAEEALSIINPEDGEPTVSTNENQDQLAVKFTTCQSGKIDLAGKVFIGRGGFGRIYKCTYISDDNKETQVAVKRILHENVSKEEEVMFSLKGHINVVKLITTAKDGAFRYYVLELCRASLDQIYLEDGNDKKYSGPIPPTEDMLLQLAEGLKYIHANNFIHGDITPRNVLIWVGPSAEQKNEIQVLMKWADFGLSKPTNERGTYIQSSVLKGTEYWLAPELTNSTNSSNRPRGTNKSDIYAQGLVFLYILLGNQYLKSKDSQVTKEPFKFKGLDSVQDIPLEYDWVTPLIKDKMLKTKPEYRLTAGEVVEQLLKVIPNKNSTRISIQEAFYLEFENENSKKSLCFPGYCIFGNNQSRQRVFIRKYILSQDDSKCKETTRDLEVLRKFGCKLHENFIRFIGSGDDEGKINHYAATEFCQYSLEDLFERAGETCNSTIITRLVRNKLGATEILRQSTEGVAFLHGLGYLHRNLKPSNFRIATYNNEVYQIKLTDFRKSKDFHLNTLPNSGTLGTQGWIAPECTRLGSELHQSVDVFILGTLYYYILSGGVHPFDVKFNDTDIQGNRVSRIQNSIHPIYQNDWTSCQQLMKQEYWKWWNPVMNSTEAEETLLNYAMDLIKSMVKHKPEERIESKKIMDHNFFKPSNWYEIYCEDTHRKPGLLMVFCHTRFGKKKEDIPGQEERKKKLSHVFRNLGFDIQMHTDLKAKQIKNTILNLANDQHKLRIYNSLCVCFISHGASGVIYGSDKKKVSIHEIQYCFNSHNCPAMHNKPKVFIFQSCRDDNSLSLKLGSIEIKGSFQMKIVDDKSNTAKKPDTPVTTESKNLSPINDFLCVMSTVEDSKAYAWSGDFINSLCSNLEKEEQDFEDVLGKVRSDMGQQDWMEEKSEGTKKPRIQTPELTSSLRKHIVLKINQSVGVELN